MWDFELAVSDAAKGALRQVSRTVGPLDQKLQSLEKADHRRWHGGHLPVLGSGRPPGSRSIRLIVLM